MSRIGKKVIPIPKGVKIDTQPGAVEVQGPKGKLRQPLPAGIGFQVEGDQLQARTEREDPQLGKFHGLARSLVANAVRGVTEGYKKELDIVGVGYRAEVKGKQVHFALGYSHPVVFDIPTGIDVAVDKQTHVTVTGIDRQLVGQVIDDMSRTTLASAASTEPSLKTIFAKETRGGNIAGAKALGKTIAERLKDKGINRVVFDRGGYLYHGRIKAVAEAAREAGLEF